MTAPSTEKVIADILAGRHDGKLWQLGEALAARLNSEETGLLWRITLDGETLDAETVTLGELRRIEGATGKSYLDLDPGKSMREFSAVVVAHYMTQGLTYEKAVEKADAITQPQVIAAITMYEGTLGKGSPSTDT